VTLFGKLMVPIWGRVFSLLRPFWQELGLFQYNKDEHFMYVGEWVYGIKSLKSLYK